jgi:TolB-like protein/tetratricopeptide (TPR) repeat protein
LAEGSRAVFLSYASQDAEAALRICEALRAGGIEVWFDRSELRGGDVWDQTIRRQIKACALFIAVISRHTHERDEGYFRLEWKLAVDRSYLMTANRTFLLPVVVDDTREDEENVPDRFRDVQWTRLPAGETPLAFVERVRRLLEPDTPAASPGDRAAAATPVTPPGTRAASGTGRRQLPAAMVALGVLVLAGLAFLVRDRLVALKPVGETHAPAATTTASAFTPPPHSIAVLPFANLSGDKDQEYFSDGLTEELLNSLAGLDRLQVAARTSAFSFKGTNTDIGTIARKLNVATVLEGSVRRGGKTVRITAQLIDARSGYHLWSKTYDRDLSDVLKLQTEIATAVADALKVTLLGDVSTKVELGGTRIPAAFDAYLRGRRALQRKGQHGLLDALAEFTEAIRLDPRYALALAERSMTHAGYATNTATGDAVREHYDQALADARQALALAPELAEAHQALGLYYDNTLDFVHAREAIDRARSLAPGNADVLRLSGLFFVAAGEVESGLAALRRAVGLDPLNPKIFEALSRALYYARRPADAVGAANAAVRLDAEYKDADGWRGLAHYALGDMEHAAAACEGQSDDWLSQQCLAVTYEKLGRHRDAEAQLEHLKTALGDDAAYQFATIYAQWGDRPQALQWLETALRMRDPGLINLNTDPLMDPLRGEPRFQKVLAELKFPDPR